MIRIPKHLLLAVAILASGLSGCGFFGPSTAPLTESQMEDIRLSDVGELYRSYQDGFKKAPKSLKDFMKVGDAAAPTGFEAIRSKQVVVRWNATLPSTSADASAPPSEEVLAYVKEVPEKGGAVLMLDRRIRHMTPEEFKGAKLAGTE